MYVSASMGENVSPFNDVCNTVWGFPQEDFLELNGGMKIADVRRSNLIALMKKMTDGNITRFGELIGRSQSATSDLMSGRKSFGEKMARSIEQHLNLPALYLDNINVFVSEDGKQIVVEGGPNIAAGPDHKGKVPLISWVQAGNFCSTIDNHQPGIADDWIDTTISIKNHTYALKVVGDSMEPMFPEGTIIIVEPEMEALPGDFVIARNRDHEATFKQLIKDGPDWFLRPLNSRYPLKPLTESDEICGVIRAAEHRFR